MNPKSYIFLASMILLVSCTDEAQELANEQSQTLKQIVMTTQDFQTEVDSRTDYEIGEAVKCTWAANDTVGVFPEEGAQAYFPMGSGEGTNKATFDGKGWALKDGRTYGAYYPFIGAMYLDRNAVPVSYEGQIQKGNASTAHLGAFDYMVATPTTSEFGSAHFTFKHLSALIQLRITVPQLATLTSVKLVTDTEAFAVKGEVDIMADAPSIKPVDSAKEIVLNLQEVATTEENQVVTFYMMIPPVDLSEQTLKAVIVSDNGNQEIVFEGKDFKAGTAYGLSGEIESTEAGYKDGVVTLVEAGTMKQLLGDDWLNITSLKVVGPINGDDVRCLRQMLGGDEFSDSEKGELVKLNLSEASIVEGGGWYYKDSSYNPKQYYVSNDVIGEWMFYKCTNLQNMVLPNSVTSINGDAFRGCASLISIDIPDGVISIGSYVFFECSSLITIDLPKGLVSIEECTFSGCSSLISINIPDSVTKIGKWAFYGCQSLNSIDIPDNVTSIGEYRTFASCSSLVSIVLPDGITSIGNSVFQGCSSLISIDMPSSITSIDGAAFDGCSSLISIDIPSGVISIGGSAFRGCSSLTSIDIPSGVTSIGNETFSDCSSLTSIDIPSGIISIGSSAFRGCSSLTSIDIPSGVTSIGNETFSYCSSLISIDIPVGVTSIGGETFKGCYRLTSINLPFSVITIGNEAFYGCSSLKSVYITDLSAWCNITFSGSSSNPLYYGAKLYLNNNELTELVIPEGITQIKKYAFYGYKSLQKVTMGTDVTSIGIHSFRNCSSLTQVYCNGTTPPTINPSSANSSFNGSSDNRTLYVPADCVSKYQSSDWASFFKTIVEME